MHGVEVTGSTAVIIGRCGNVAGAASVEHGRLVSQPDFEFVPLLIPATLDS